MFEIEKDICIGGLIRPFTLAGNRQILPDVSDILRVCVESIWICAEVTPDHNLRKSVFDVIML